MFETFGDMPLHPLVIHAPVVGIPLSLMVVLLFILPRTRPWARWPLAIVVIGATAATIVAKQTGEGLQRLLAISPGNPVGDLIQTHSELATQLVIIMVIFAAVVLMNVFMLARVSRGIGIILLALLLTAGSMAVVWVIRVGDLGARAVWNPSGTAF